VKVIVRHLFLLFFVAFLFLATTRGQSNDNARWEYGSTPDKMTGKDTVYASLDSDDGMHLSIEQQVPRYPLTVYIFFLEGNENLFFCGLRGCTINVRFDDGKIEPWSAREDSSGSAKVLYFTYPQNFVARLKKAHRIVVEVPVFQRGPMQFEFFVNGLVWPPPSTSSEMKAEDSETSDKSASVTGEEKVSPPACFYQPNPPLTEEAKAAKFVGTVDIEVTVTVDGAIESIKILKSPGLGLDESINRTVKQWRCKPAIGLNGRPISFTAPFHISFDWYRGTSIK